MDNDWIEAEANHDIETYGAQWGRDLVLLAYATRLVGSRSDLAMHGGGNTSIKGSVKTLAGDEAAALFVKASGIAMDVMTPAVSVCLDQAYLKRLRALSSLTDEAMAGEFRTRLLRPSDALPSIETLMHAFLDRTAILHTHPAAILSLANRVGGEETLVAALGNAIGVVPYVNSGRALGRAVADVYDRGKELQAIVILHHGLITWGETPKEAYDRTIEIVSRAEEHLRASRRPLFSIKKKTDPETVQKRYTSIAPLLRGLLSPPSADPDRPYETIILAPHLSAEMLDFLDSPRPVISASRHL